MKTKLTTMCLLLVAAAMQAAVPNGYYKSLDGKSGRALKDAIHTLTRNRTVHSYGSLWTYFPQTDRMPNDPSRVWDMYSDKTYYFSARLGSSTSGMNKEHSLPKSWWGGYTEAQGYTAYTDLNHLYPSDAAANSAKLHYPLGEVQTVYFDNGVSRTGIPRAGQGGGSSMVFEPDDRYKGDFARTYFYMAACYQDYEWKYKWMYTELSWLTLNPWAIDMLLRWAREDPVSDKEKDRNEAVFRCQNNRNPFIDNPELIEYIWGNRYGETYVDGGEITGDPELLTPTQGTVVNFGEVAVGNDLRLTLYVKGQNLTQDLTVTLYSGDTDAFSIPAEKIDRSMACTATGYPLVITYHPTGVGDHTTRLLLSDGGITGSVGIGLNASCLPVPNLSAPTALPAQEVTDSSYVAAWRAVPEDVDYYVVNRTIYDGAGSIIDSEAFTTDDGEQTMLMFTDRQASHVHTYSVQGCRLGVLSAMSNVITIDASGITGTQADRPLALIATEGGVLVKCDEPLQDVTIYTPDGQVVHRMSVVENDDIIKLPIGVYILTTLGSRQAYKLAIR
ncbi:MAG: endonuclease [Muribaculaceae bacterium]|nr:endonuclease [Muribaculaceae bacterium]